MPRKLEAEEQTTSIGCCIHVTEIHLARQAAEQASRSKSEFLANMSHVIRTPMNVILGMTDLILETPLSPFQREKLLPVKSSADALLTVINDILDFSKIEAGKFALETAPFRLREMLDNTIKALAQRAHAKNLELACRIAAEIPESLSGDPGRLGQVIVNLVGNAIKFTERGEVILSVSSQTRGDDCVEFLFSVADTGIGVPPEKRDLIFQPFEQARRITADRDFPRPGLIFLGTGAATNEIYGHGESDRFARLNKPIRQSDLYHAMNILLLGVNSRKEEPRAETLPGRPSNPRPGRSLDILLAEDHLVNQKVAVAMLEGMGHRVTLVADGRKAVEAWLLGSFDLILMDVQMPEMDGFEAVAAIRQIDNLGERPALVIALTAHAMKDDRHRCLQSGFDDYLSKPIRSRELSEMIEKWLPMDDERPVLARVSPDPPVSIFLEFDRDAALVTVGGDEDLLVEVIGIFLDETPRLLNEIEQAIVAESNSQVARLAHSLRGAASNFAMPLVLKAAARLERDARSASREELRTDFNDLSHQLSRVRPQLEAVAAEHQVARIERTSQVSATIHEPWLREDAGS